MSASPVTDPVNPLPRDIDVSVTISRPQTELQSDLSRLCFATPSVNFPPNNSRARIYRTFQSVIDDTGWLPADTGYWAAKAVFDQSVHPQEFVVGRVFEEAVPAQLMGAAIIDLAPLAAISDGSFVVTVADDTGTPVILSVENIDLTGVINVAGVATAVNSAISDASLNTQITASVEYSGRLTLTAIGGNVTITHAEAGVTGTDVSDLLKLSQVAGGQKWDAYAPNELASEIQMIASAARVSGYQVFGWALDKKYRDTPAQKTVSDWAETQSWKAWAIQCTNSPTAYDSGDTTNICYYGKALAYKATSVQYSAYPQYYPEITYAMQPLAVNYGLRDSVVTACFKNASGIPVENLTEAQLAVLTSRNCNTFVQVGNTARTHRYGTQTADTWWTDSYCGACNYREAIQTNVANCLYRNKVVPYTPRGQIMIVSAIDKACSDYVYNGYLAERQIIDETNENGYATLKPYDIQPTLIYRATETQRAKGILPPIQVVSYEAGAIRHVDIYVDLIN